MSITEIATLAGYTDWMRDLLAPIPDGHYELKSFSADEGRAVVTAFADFDGDRIRHMTKIWNDVQSLRALGCA
jgi:hypothetical protein